MVSSSSDIQTTLLFSLVAEDWANLSPETFWERYDSEVGDVEEVEGQTVQTHAVDLPSFGPSVVRVLTSGLCILEAGRGLSLYETEALYRHKTHLSAWADFARGYWSRKVPTKPGRYFVKDLDEGRIGLRVFKRVDGKLRDVSGGMVRNGNVTEYQGFFWLPPIPLLPGAKE